MAVSQTARTAAKSTMARPRSKIWLERGDRVALSEWRVELLTAVDRTGSLAAAAAELAVPYRTAWTRLKETEEALGFRLLDTQVGGAEGGGSSITPEARQLLERFKRVMAGIAELVDQRFRVEFGDDPL